MSLPQTPGLAQALAAYDRAAGLEDAAAAEAERQEILSRFPLAGWPSMTLEQYALGRDSFCGWLEYRSPHLGSIAGGSAGKHLIDKRRSGGGWRFDPAYPSVDEAWRALRASFVRALDLAQAGEWDAIGQLIPVSAAPALLIKTLHVYFPAAILPIASQPHLLHFLQLLGAADPSLESGGCIALNRALLQALRSIPDLQDWSANELERFLYFWSDPRAARRVVKISPGEDARLWDDCLANGYIRTGWDATGDLREFSSKEEFAEAFRQEYSATYNHHLPAIRKKANELWTLAGLEEGDIVLANKGTSQILAAGEVLAPGYEFRPDLPEFRHTVRVNWDTSAARAIPPQKRWAFLTVAPVPPELYESILHPSGPAQAPRRSAAPAVVNPLFLEWASSLERTGQLILYGPPGTGKTYSARRFAVWWLLRNEPADPAAALSSPEQYAEAERRLTAGARSRRVWWVVANPKEWAWDNLFEHGSERWSRRRLQSHFQSVRPGDLIAGYQASPDQRVVAIAQVSRTPAPTDPDGFGFEAVPLRRVAGGPSWQELCESPVFKNSEPVRFNNQGTLFALAPAEAGELADLIAAQDPESAALLAADAPAPLVWTTFHPSYSYEDFVEGLRPFDAGDGRAGLRVEDGLFKRLCRAAASRPGQKFLLVIDEFNRAHAAKVFGELITLLERDKRGLSVILPYSKEPFSIPPNLHILATMNTADRSIRLLDSALRRRFAFHEVLPDSSLLQGASAGPLALDEFMDALNARIAKHLGREKQIGHSYFLEQGQPVSCPAAFARKFRQEILPLLQEYCYDDFNSLQTYIGPRFIAPDLQRLNEDLLNDPGELAAALAQFLEEEPVP